MIDATPLLYRRHLNELCINFVMDAYCTPFRAHNAQIGDAVKYIVKRFIESRAHSFQAPAYRGRERRNHSISENLFDLACRRRPNILNVTITDLIHFD